MKVFFLVFAIVICAILIAQNTDVVTLQFLVWQLDLSLVVLILLTLVLGMIIGAVGGKALKGKR